MAQEAEVKVRIRQEGADETKQALLETKAAMLGVSSGELKHAQTTRELARDANILNNMERFKTRIFLAQNPIVNNLTKAMSTFGSVSRGVLAITTAFSTAIAAFNSTSNGLAQIQEELQQARREQALALEKYGYDSEEYAEATEKVNDLESRMGELNNQLGQEKVTNVLNFAAAIGVVGGSIAQVVNSGVVASLAAKLGPLGLSGALAGVGVAAAGVGGGILHGFGTIDSVTDTVNLLMEAITGVDLNLDRVFGRNLEDLFSGRVPKILELGMMAFQIFWNGIIMSSTIAMNVVMFSIESMVNSAISTINKLIRGVNAIAGALGLPKIGLIGSVSLGGMSQDSASGSSRLSSSDMVSLRARGGATGAPQVVNNITIQGSVQSEMEMAKFMDKVFKDTLKRYGWA